MLDHKKILIGISGSISAYKMILLVRLLVKAHAEVKVILTPAAKEFVSELTLATLSKNAVLSTMVDEGELEEKKWNNHVELGEWADLFIVAPASANTLSKMANGTCDNLVLAVYLSAKCPVWFAPAMDLDMFKHQSTKENIAKLESYGNVLIPPGSGELASGLVGEGRLAEPEEIFEKVLEHFNPRQPLLGKSVLVTAGPTYEYIDPVRYVGNPSSGKMGIAIAERAAQLGAKVYLIAGPTQEKISHPHIHRTDIVSAQEMFLACKKLQVEVDIAIMAAAVADYTPIQKSEHKVKKGNEELTIVFKRTEDILKYFGEHKPVNQTLVGFAMETDHELENALSKLHNKNADLIVLNSLQEKGAGFRYDTNKVTLIEKSGKQTALELKSKRAVAQDILEKVLEICKQKELV